MLYNEVSNRLQNLTNTKISQQTIANCLGVAQTAISSRIKTDKSFSLDELMKIEQCLALPIGSLSGVTLSDIQLDYYPDILASCGVGCCIPTESKEKIAVTKDIISNYSPSKRYSIVNAYGDSMQPYIHDKDLLIVEHTTEQIKDGRVYIFRYEDALYVKRLVNNITEVIAKSDNAEYKPVILDKKTDDFEVIGQIVGLIRDLR